jgi:hypothetical protein
MQEDSHDNVLCNVIDEFDLLAKIITESGKMEHFILLLLVVCKVAHG